MFLQYDAIIVGARAAGAPLAMLLSQRGHKVLLVDRATFPSETLSTHLCQPRAMAYLHRWGLAESVHATTPVFSSFQLNREGIVVAGAPTQQALARCLAAAHGWSTTRDGATIPVEWACVRRGILDALLVEAAGRAGADVRQGFRVTALDRRGGRVAGIRGQFRDEEVVAHAPVVIGADGRNSRVAGEVGAEVLARSEESDFTFYTYFQGVSWQDLQLPLHVRGRLTLAYAPTNGGEVLVSVFGPEAWAADFMADTERHFYATVDELYPELGRRLRSGGRRTEPFRGLPRQPCLLRRAHGPGWALIGDAGQCLSQCTAIGITNAFRDAELLSHHLHGALSGDTTLDQATAAYDAQRLAMSLPYFDLVAQTSKCALPTADQLGLLRALQDDSKAAGELIGVIGTVVPVQAFFAPDRLQEIMAPARTLAADVPIPEALDAANARYARNPFSNAAPATVELQQAEK